MDDVIAARALGVYTCPSRGGQRTVRHEPPSSYAAFGTRGCMDYAGNGGPFSFAEGRGGKLGQVVNPPPRDPCPPAPGTRPWSDKMDRPFLGEGHSHGSFRLGMFVKNRFWPHYPNPAWSKPVYVDLPLRAARFWTAHRTRSSSARSASTGSSWARRSAATSTAGPAASGPTRSAPAPTGTFIPRAAAARRLAIACASSTGR